MGYEQERALHPLVWKQSLSRTASLASYDRSLMAVVKKILASQNLPSLCFWVWAISNSEDPKAPSWGCEVTGNLLLTTTAPSAGMPYPLPQWPCKLPNVVREHLFQSPLVRRWQIPLKRCCESFFLSPANPSGFPKRCFSKGQKTQEANPARRGCGIPGPNLSPQQREEKPLNPS